MRKKKVEKILQTVKDNYNEIASEFSVSRNKKLWPEVISQIKKVKSNDKVLDVGCGNGRLVEEIDKEAIYLGVDNSHELLKIAKDKYRDRKNTNFLELSALELEKIKEINFDFIFSIAILHHIPSKELRIKSLKLLKDKLNIKGEMLITAWNMWAWKKFRWQIIKSYFNFLQGLNTRDLLFYWKAGKQSLRYYHAFTLKGLKKEIRKADLEIIASKKGKGGLYVWVKKNA